ncbi:MAG: DUF4433 domain-containing protein, partial [Bacteroidetes bacterium]|nr:DUF4433 domain-containing protein [Bacteroidota bacterium]
MAQTLIYHITHVDNLQRILTEGGLWCKAEQIARTVEYQNIAHQNIQDRRATTPVSCGPGGVLHNYVPFYFAPRAPMLYAIHNGRVQGYTGGQTAVVHLVSSVERIVEAQLPFVFTDGHGTVAYTSFFEHLDDLTKIDWKVMQARYWNNTLQDSDRKRRRQAEFLIHTFCPWERLLGIGVGVGLLSGLMGVGGGFLIVPALLWFTSLSLLSAMATSMAVIAVVSGGGFLLYLTDAEPPLPLLGGLALGGAFLVKYTIDQGLLGPKMRIFLGLLLSLAMIGTGEWVRRKGSLPEMLSRAPDYIPTALAAAGLFTAFATIYAAQALYGLIPPIVAFGLLAVVGFLGMALALLYGPLLAFLGLIVASAVPL